MEFLKGDHVAWDNTVLPNTAGIVAEDSEGATTLVVWFGATTPMEVHNSELELRWRAATAASGPIERGRHETAWRALTASVGDDDPTLNTALAGAMATIKRRDGVMPGWDDKTAWEDLYSVALDNYRDLVTL